MKQFPLSQRFAKVAAGSMVMGAALLPLSSKAQGTFQIVNAGAISEVDGTGSSLPGFSMGTSGIISISGNLSDIQIYEILSGETIYSDPYSIDSFVGSNVTNVLQGVLFQVAENGYGPNGACNSLGIVLPPNINDGVNGLDLFFPKGTIATTAWNGGATTMLQDAQSAVESGLAGFSIGYDPTGNNGAGGWTSSFSFTLITNAPSLSIALGGKEAALSWPTNAAGFQLQSSSFLGANANWATVTNAAAIAGTNYLVNLPLTNQCEFFRLEETN
jgi:hypothetical protein